MLATDHYFGIGDWHFQLGTIGEWIAGTGAVVAVGATVVPPDKHQQSLTRRRGEPEPELDDDTDHATDDAPDD